MWSGLKIFSSWMQYQWLYINTLQCDTWMNFNFFSLLRSIYYKITYLIVLYLQQICHRDAMYSEILYLHQICHRDVMYCEKVYLHQICHRDVMYCAIQQQITPHLRTMPVQWQGNHRLNLNTFAAHTNPTPK